MNYISTIIEQAISELFNIQNFSFTVERTDQQFGDYASNVAMRLAKELSANPRQIAEKIVQKLESEHADKFSEVTLAGPGFINFRIPAKSLASHLGELISQYQDQGLQFGQQTRDDNAKLIVDFSSPNLAKPFSVGHLRSTIQGWAIRNLAQSQGFEVITDSHLGDYGTPFGKWVVGFLRYSSEEQLSTDGIHELARVYIAITADMKSQKEQGITELHDEVQQWLLRLDREDPEAVSYKDKFQKISLDHIHSILTRIGVTTDYEYGESFYVPEAQKYIDELISRGIAEQGSDGSVVVHLKEYGIDVPALLRKSNGSAMYMSTDLQTARFRQQMWQPHTVIIETGGEQQFHFKQLFALLHKIGLDQTNWLHIWHGVIDTINDEGKREKMSSRKGVVTVEELLDFAEKKASELFAGNDNVDEEDIKKVALGAVKFADLGQDKRTNVLFDWDKIFSLSGYSGPYIQYSAVRLMRILEKADTMPVLSIDGYDWESERQLLLKNFEFLTVLQKATNTYEVHHIAVYLYELGQIINQYYEQTPVNKPEVEDIIKQNRLWLLQVTLDNIKYGLQIMGIEVPNKM